MNDLQNCYEVPLLRPLRGMILVKADPKKTKIGRIHLPDMVIQDAYSADVIAVGAPEIELKRGHIRMHDIEPGMHVLFSKWEGVELPYPWDNYAIMRAEDVIAVLSPEAHAEYVRYPDTDSSESEEERIGGKMMDPLMG